MYVAAINSAYTHLVRPIKVVTGVEDMMTIGDVHFNVEYEGGIVSWYSLRLGLYLSFTISSRR